MSSTKFQFLDFSELEDQDFQTLTGILENVSRGSDLYLSSDSQDEKDLQANTHEVTIYNETCKDFISISKEVSGTPEYSFFIDGGSADDAFGTPPLLLSEGSHSQHSQSEVASPTCIEQEEQMSMEEHMNMYSHSSTPQPQYMNQQHPMGPPPPGAVPPMPNAGPPLQNVPPQYQYPPFSSAHMPNPLYPQMPSAAMVSQPTVYVENCHVNFPPYGNQHNQLYQANPHYQHPIYQSYVMTDQNVPPIPVKTAHDKMDYEHKRHDHQNRGAHRGRGRGRGRRRGREDHERSNSVSSDHSSYSDSGKPPIFKDNAGPPSQPNPYTSMYHQPYSPYQIGFPMNNMPRHQGIPLMQHPPPYYDHYPNQQTLLAYHPHSGMGGVTPVSVAPQVPHHETLQPQPEADQYNQDQATTIAHHATYISTSVVTQQSVPVSSYSEMEEGITAVSLEVPGQTSCSVDEGFSEEKASYPEPEAENVPEEPVIEVMIINEQQSFVSSEEQEVDALSAKFEEAKLQDVPLSPEYIPPNTSSEVDRQISVTEQEAAKNSLNKKKSQEFSAPMSIPTDESFRSSDCQTPPNYTKSSANEKEANGDDLVAPVISTKTIRRNSKENKPIAIFGSFSDDATLQNFQDIPAPSSKKVLKETANDVKQKIKPAKENIQQAAKVLTESMKELADASKPISAPAPVPVPKEVVNETPIESVWGKKKSWSQLFKPNDGPSNKQIAYVSPFNAHSHDQDCDQQTLDNLKDVVPVEYSDREEEKAKVGAVLDSYEPDYRPVQLQPRGLINKNYWCYVNAPMQALLACPSLYQLMLTLTRVAGYKSANTSTPFINSIVDFCEDFSVLAPSTKTKKEKAIASKKEPELSLGSPLEPTCVYKMLTSSKDNQFTEGRQQDAEEMLSYVLNGLHDEMVEATKLAGGNVAVNGTATRSEAAPLTDDESEWKVQGPKRKSCVTRTAHFSPSPISQIFWGRLRSVLQHNGGSPTANLQPFNSLPLDIQSPKVDTLKDALSQLVTREEITGFTCPRTNQEVTASNQVMLEDLPRVLILQLKRFIYDKDGGLQKNTKRLQFPIDLEITKDLLSQNSRSKFSPSQRKFKLFAIVNHEGKEATKGHYVADVFHTGYNCWIRYDDASVKPLTESTVLRHEPPRVPYLLFYRRSDTLLPSSTSSKQPSKS